MNGTVNKVILVGHLGDEVKLNTFDNGGAIARFRLATNEAFSTKSGEKKVHTEWHHVFMRNKAAEICAARLSKGDKVYVEGAFRTRDWTDEEEVKHYITEVEASSFSFLSVKKDRKEEEALDMENKGA